MVLGTGGVLGRVNWCSLLVVPWFCLFCFHFLQVQRPKLQVLDSLEKKSVIFFCYSGIKGTWKSTGLLNPDGKLIKNGTFSYKIC